MKSEQVRKFYFGFTNIVLLIFVITSIVILRTGEGPDWGIMLATGVTIFGTLITLLLSSQRQALEELTIIRQLFKEFNDRYHCMNDELNRIKNREWQEDDDDLTDDNKNLLYDYFNLCGEEYLYYQRGFIYPEVWGAWCNGMLDYLNNDRIGKLWKEEEQTNSYYRLTYDKILQGCRLNNRLK